MAQAEQCRIFAVVGLSDKGNTFLINQLFGFNMPSVKLQTTGKLVWPGTLWC